MRAKSIVTVLACDLPLVAPSLPLEPTMADLALTQQVYFLETSRSYGRQAETDVQQKFSSSVREVRYRERDYHSGRAPLVFGRSWQAKGSAGDRWSLYPLDSERQKFQALRLSCRIIRRPC